MSRLIVILFVSLIINVINMFYFLMLKYFSVENLFVIKEASAMSIKPCVAGPS